MGKFDVLNMCSGAAEVKIKNKHTIDDLSKFFKDRSKAISEKFSNERFKISTIRSKKIGDNNEFSFNLKLLPTNEEQFLIKPVVDFFRICLSHKEDYKLNMTVPEKSRELYDTHCANNRYNTVEQFINGAPSEILSNGIVIKLKTSANNIDPSKLDQIDLHLPCKEVEEHVATENKTQDEASARQTEEQGSFLPCLAPKPVTETEKKDSGENLNTSNGANSSEEKENHNTESEHIKVKPTLIQKGKRLFGIINDDDIRAQDVIKRAQGYVETEIILNENWSREKPKTLDEIFCEAVITHYDPKYPKFLMEITESVFKAVFLQDTPEKGEHLEEDILNVLKKFGLEFNRNYLIKKIDNEKEKLEIFIGYNASLPDKSSRIQKLYDKYSGYHITMYKARKKIQKIVENDKDKTREEKFIEVMKSYRDQDRLTFINIFDIAFNEIFCDSKDPEKVETLEEVFSILKLMGEQFNVKYLEDMVWYKESQLFKQVSDIIDSQSSIQHNNNSSKATDHSSENEAKTSPSTVNLSTSPNTRLESRSKIRRKLMLENIFYSPETYFCLFSIVAFISTLYLWHFPPIWMAILKESMPSQKREEIGSVLNIGLPILIVLCIANLVHFIYSEYSGYVKFVEQENARNLQPSLEL